MCAAGSDAAVAAELNNERGYVFDLETDRPIRAARWSTLEQTCCRWWCITSPATTGQVLSTIC